jgi:tRNA wybutosine-synthesizing protein 1
MDLEDMGNVIALAAENDGIPQEMVTPSQAAALKKEGYKLIGTHSAVKLCRWTKHQLRGRGGCYKHTFYGITSYQCMEATPSLACANKCKSVLLFVCAVVITDTILMLILMCYSSCSK